ncbi:30S ribosomal protein S17 [Candidatus Beckwithbacteria bacterium]|nr:30S ribosomal protein S17 [Candidatus Beckwithbacteria bacterium]
MKTLTGKVISNKMENTVTVLVENMWQHPVYQKSIKRSKKFLAHTDKKITEGKFVVIAETRPISKRKNWKVLEVIKK